MNFRASRTVLQLLQVFALLFFVVLATNASSLDKSDSPSYFSSGDELVQVRHANPAQVENVLVHAFDERVRVAVGKERHVRQKRQFSTASVPDSNGKCASGCVIDRRRKICNCRRKRPSRTRR